MASVELEATSNAKNLKTRFNTASEVNSFLTRFMGCIQRSRSALVNPKKRTLEELRNSKNVVWFMIRFYNLSKYDIPLMYFYVVIFHEQSRVCYVF